MLTCVGVDEQHETFLTSVPGRSKKSGSQLRLFICREGDKNTNCKRDWVAVSGGLDVSGNRLITCPFRESIHYFSVVQPIAYLYYIVLYIISYTSYHIIYRIVSYRIVSHHIIISYHISYHMISCHTYVYHIVSYRIVSHDMT